MSLVLEKKFKGEAKFLHFVFMVSRQWITEKGKEARNILQLHQHPKIPKTPFCPSALKHSSTDYPILCAHAAPRRAPSTVTVTASSPLSTLESSLPLQFPPAHALIPCP